MATSLRSGHRVWRMTRDDDGYRNYEITHLVKCASTDGPARALQTAGLPLPGSRWQFDDDLDVWVWCRPSAEVDPWKDEVKNRYFSIKQVFSNRPLDRGRARCHDLQIEDPLLEPAKVSGSFIKYQEEASFDRFGNAIVSSSFEPFRGPQVEFDKNRLQIKIEQNIALLGLATLASMIDTVNSNVLWGLPARCIKLSNATFEEQWHGLCYKYYKRTLEFDINYNTFDRLIADEGAKVLNGHWGGNGNWINDPVGGQPVDADNPQHFRLAIDRQGNPMRMLLNGAGNPAETNIGTGTGVSSGGVGQMLIQKYTESNFLLLGIPVTF